MSLLKRMLEQLQSPTIKIRVCSVIGLLIRHSTMIENELAEIDIISQLIVTMRDREEIVRRRAIAALGEYMFYAATQLDDELADPIWELSDDAINIIVESLDDQETDKIVKFYACKTLENICA
jgi:serine/threonine-protein kinase ULK4